MKEAPRKPTPPQKASMFSTAEILAVCGRPRSCPREGKEDAEGCEGHAHSKGKSKGFNSSVAPALLPATGGKSRGASVSGHSVHSVRSVCSVLTSKTTGTNETTMTTPSARRKSKLPANLKTTGLDDDDDNNKKTTTNTTTDNNDGTINTNDLWAPPRFSLDRIKSVLGL